MVPGYGSLLLNSSNIAHMNSFFWFQKVFLHRTTSQAVALSCFAFVRVILRGLDQDNEEVRLRLEDVGVFYEES